MQPKAARLDRVGVPAELVPVSLKQQLLLFDRLAIIELEEAISLARSSKKLLGGDDRYGPIANDLEFLVDRGLVFEAGIFERLPELMDQCNDPQEALSFAHLILAQKDHSDAHTAMQNLAKHAEGKEGLSKREFARFKRAFVKNIYMKVGFFQVASRIIAHRLRALDGVEASPILVGDLISLPSLAKSDAERRRRKTDVVEIVLRKVPMPSEDAPWEKILEFRDDPETKGFLQGLRVWMADLSKEGFSPVEATEKLDWMLFQRERHLKVHKITYNLTAFGEVFVAIMDVLEDVVKIKWGKAARGIVGLTRRKAELMKLEVESPAREVHYLMKARRAFGE
jgi:hypothetical protein